ncbi:inositol monophosphatase family protein, partial [Brucella abortus]|uniref:inositol monophosphatase family protein n=1 Tax=Brucella abortus TaxID=235 RepID=UPI00321850B8
METKADASPVTEADRAAEALILARLAERWPRVEAVAEEAVAADGAPPSVGEWCWLIDPLDGTRGFVQGRESYSVNI